MTTAKQGADNYRLRVCATLLLAGAGVAVFATFGSTSIERAASRIWRQPQYAESGATVLLGAISLVPLVLAVGAMCILFPTSRLTKGVAILSAVAAYTAHAFLYRDFVIDDAGVTFTYAKHLAEGHGLVFNIGGPRVEGFSNFAWMLLLAAAAKLGANPVLASKILGLVLTAGAIVYLWMMRSAFDSDNSNTASFSLAVLAASLSTSVVVWTSSGLENGLTLLATTALLYHFWRCWGDSRASLGNALLASCWSLVLVLNRPEGILTFVALSVLVGIDLVRGRASVRAGAGYILPCALGFAAFLCWRFVYFGDWLPNTAYAKLTPSIPSMFNPGGRSWSQIAELLTKNVLILAVPSVFLFIMYGSWSRRILLVLMTVVGANVAFHVFAHGDWMGQGRFLTASIPLVFLVAFISLQWSARLLAVRARDPGCVSGVLVTVFALVVLIAQVPQTLAMLAEPPTQFSHVRARAHLFKAMAERLGVESPSVLDHDAGGSSYDGLLEVIDSGLLNDRTLAKGKYERRVIEGYVFEKLRPTFIFNGENTKFLSFWGIAQDELEHLGYMPLRGLRHLAAISSASCSCCDGNSDDFWSNSFIRADIVSAQAQRD